MKIFIFFILIVCLFLTLDIITEVGMNSIGFLLYSLFYDIFQN